MVGIGSRSEKSKIMIVVAMLDNSFFSNGTDLIFDEEYYEVEISKVGLTLKLPSLLLWSMQKRFLPRQIQTFSFCSKLWNSSWNTTSKKIFFN